MARTSKAHPAPEPEPKMVLPEADGEVTLPGEAVDPFVIGPESLPFSSGWLMGIGSRPETPAEHATRLGAAAGKFNDIGFLTGTLAARPEWPAENAAVQPPP